MRPLVVAALCCLLLIVPMSSAVHACTSFCMSTPDGPVCGFNLDLFIPGDGLVFINRRGVAKEGFQTSPTGEVARWVSSYGSVSFNVAGLEFACGGMNEAGLVVMAMELLASELPEADERAPLTIGTWAQYVLDTCGSVEEAIAADARVRIEDLAPPVHYLVADASGAGAAIEWLKGELVVHTGAGLPVAAMSNMPYAEALSDLERGGHPWWLWWRNPGQSAERFAAAHARSTDYDAGRDGDPVAYAFGTLTHVVAAPHTKWNIVYDLAKRELWFRSVASPGVKHVGLEAFDLRCDAPLLMLDVNALLEGDVQPSFGPYDSENNISKFRLLRDRFELEVSDDAIESTVRHFESFGCAP